MINGKIKVPISIIVPCYNEMVVLPKTIDILNNFFQDKFEKYEIIIINDGSSDRTSLLMNQMFNSKQYKNLHYIEYQENQGKGHAVHCGLYYSNYELKLILDCDLSVKPEIAYRCIIDQKFNFDFKIPFVVIGKRYQLVSQPKYRVFLGRCFHWLVYFLVGIKYEDTQCPMKILYNVKKSDLEKLSIKGFAYDVELIKMLEQKRYLIYEDLVPYYNDKKSSVTIKKTIRMGLDLFKIRRINFKN